MTWLRRLRTSLLDRIRKGPEIVWAPEWMGLGNLLYLALWSFSQNKAEGAKRVLLHSKRESALALFPTLRDHLFVRPSEVRFTDRRIMPWSGRAGESHADWLQDPDLFPFIRELMLPGCKLLDHPAPNAGTMVVNVRRGDYYSNPKHLASFGMNTVGYVQEAVKRSVEANGQPASFLVISDGPDWCRRHLGPLLEPFAQVDYQPNDLARDLAAVVQARRVVLPNSTFSYWGGYIGDALLGEREVWAPRFFSRDENQGRAYQLLDHWNVVEEPAGGWSPSPGDLDD